MQAMTKDPHLDKPKVKDFLLFCAKAKGAWPPFPITAAKLYRWFYSLMKRRNLGKSWKSILTYKKAVIRWAARFQTDPFDELSIGTREDLKKAFEVQFKVKPSQEKLQLTDDLFNGIMKTVDRTNVGDRIDGDLYTIFKVAGMRVTSLVLGSDKRRFERIVRLKHVEFLPSRQDRQRVFLLLPSTKTRSAANPVGMSLVRNTDPLSKTCAVKSLWSQVRRRERQGATGRDVLFFNVRNKRPYSRNVFTTRLKSRVDAVAAKSIGKHNRQIKPSSYISGVSFRKAVMQKLKDGGHQPTQIATYATHKSSRSQMSYVTETKETSSAVAGTLYKGLR